MKKLISVLLTLCMLATGTMALAANDNSPAATKAAATVKEKISDQAQFAQQMKDLKPQMEEIRANRAKIVKLKIDIDKAYKEAKSKLKETLSNKDSLTSEQIAALKESIKQLKTDGKLIADTKGDIRDQQLKLRDARKTKDINTVKQALAEIIKVQQTRISDLQKALGDMNAIG